MAHTFLVYEVYLINYYNALSQANKLNVLFKYSEMSLKLTIHEVTVCATVY